MMKEVKKMMNHVQISLGHQLFVKVKEYQPLMVRDMFTYMPAFTVLVI
jgi:hypothetical protein